MKIRILSFSLVSLISVCALSAQDRPQGQAPRPEGEGPRQGERRGPGGPRRGPEHLLSILPVVVALDADKDRTLTDQELEGASQKLSALDKNKDGKLSGEEIVTGASGNDPACRETLARHASRLARGLAALCNLIDPDVIVLGGGLSNMPHLYEEVPALMAPYIFSDQINTKILPPLHGDASGVRGAAWLW